MEKLVPASVDAERATLGSVLLNREALIAIAPWLKPDDFYTEAHAWIYEAMLTLYAKRTPPDLRTLSDELQRHERLVKIGGIGALAALTDGVPTSYHIMHYAKIVERTSLARKLISAGGQIAALGYDQQAEPQNAISDAQSLITGLQQRTNTKAVTMELGALEVFNELGSEIEPGLATGLDDYDALTAGLYPGTLIIVAGRPGHGKTSFAATVATRVKARTHIFSLEMPWKELIQRVIAMESNVDGLAIRRHRLNDEERQKIADAMGRVASLPITIDDAPNLTIDDIRSRSLQHVAQHGDLGLIIVDYIGLVKSEIGHGENRATAVGRVSRGAKALAKELNVPVMLLAQLNREIDKRGGDVPEPELSDLRESGDIEADADIVAFVIRPELYSDKPEYKNIARMYVKKHRGGPANKMLQFHYDGPTTRFDNLVRARAMEGYD